MGCRLRIGKAGACNRDKCRLCRKCVPVCPTNSILELNFPPKKEKPGTQLEEAVAIKS